MAGREVIDITDDEDGEQVQDDPYFDRRAILEPVVGRVVDALGGHEEERYVMGDQALACLKDLKKLWRKDETDDERTVARLFYEMRLLPNDLVAILLETAGKGLVEDKRAVSCVDLMTAMTWPIDMAEELKELDEALDKGTDYTQLLQSHLHYKAALLKPGVMAALFGIVLAPFAKSPRERVERDGQVINVVLHLIRNLAFIKDLPTSSHMSSDLAQFSNLQSKLIRALSEANVLPLLLTIAANTENDSLLNGWNTLILEIFYLLFRGVKPGSLIQDQAKQPAENLQRLLAMEDCTRRDLSRKATSRHSRFGTTIAIKLNPDKRPSTANDDANAAHAASSSRTLVLHRQSAIYAEAGGILDITKRQKNKKANKVDDFGIVDTLSVEARVVLQELSADFVESCFNPFLAGLLKDIRSERPKITEKDNIRLLYVTKWFLEFFLLMQTKEQKEKGSTERWNFGRIAEVTERTWIIWVLKRMREAVEEKPKAWTELQAGVECLTQLLLLIDKMSTSEIADDILKEAAEVLQQQLVYNGEVLDIALESLKTYKPGTQSLAYLDSSVYLAYALLRMLERWGKQQGNETYVRQRAARKKRKSRGITEEEGIPDVEEEEEEDHEEIINETMFTFEAFEMKFAQAEIAHTLLAYLARYREFTSTENMRRVVNLIHRQAVKAKAEGLFFKVSTLELFKTILADQKSLPREQSYKDLINLINFILRQFFKKLDAEPFLAVEAFFPKNRNQWKQYSSWEPEKKTSRERRAVDDTRFPQDVVVKKGFSWSEELGIAIAALLDAHHPELVEWTRSILSLVIAQRTRIILETDRQEDDPNVSDDNEDPPIHLLEQASADALQKITDYMIPYVNDEQGNAATRNPNLKLLFRLSKFYILDQDADELEWYIPSSISVVELKRTLIVINQFLETPLDLGGKKATELLSKKRRRRRRRSPSPGSGDDAVSSDEEPRRRKRKEKKVKEKEQYKSAQFIEDSDEEYGDMDAFLEKERVQREKALAAATAAGNADRPLGMKATGTKKRRRKGEDAGGNSKKRRGQSQDADTIDVDSDAGKEVSSDDDQPQSQHHSHFRAESLSPPSPSPAPAAATATTSSRPRPRPRPIRKMPQDNGDTTSPRVSPSSSPLPAGSQRSSSPGLREDSIEPERSIQLKAPSHAHRSKRLILSDDEN
ncbi:hypothetical protein D9619_010000 [Psilocybe cf. subviscida]|uniref:Timeless N-terminal domain-containing protein n=1 Tax=Psilocybe cf. subviscida TaxID=2480587 RepID=A0A8H5BLM3_9AGAR|nr:hypothetical protein D9619_010000 [Psilocybe cf. subviscida]